MTDYKLLFKVILEKLSLQVQDAMWVANGGNPNNIPDWKSQMASTLLEINKGLLDVLSKKHTKVALHSALVQGVAMSLASIDVSMLSYKYSDVLSPSEKVILLAVLDRLLELQNEACSISSRPISEMRSQAAVLNEGILELSKSLDPNQMFT